MATTAAEPVAKKKPGLLVLGLVALVSLGAGFFAPRFVPFLKGSPDGEAAKAKPASKDSEQAFVPFGEVVVNLRTATQTRYLKAKIVLVADKEEERPLTELLKKNQAFLKNSVIGYLADRSLEDVKGTAGINRIRRELLDQFNTLLYRDAPEKIKDLLFEEFFTQ